MPTSLPSRVNGIAGMGSRLKGWVLSEYLVFLVTVCCLLAVNGPQVRAAAEAGEALLIEEENKAFCSMFGVGPETARYAQCASELTQIRAHHLQRYVYDAVL